MVDVKDPAWRDRAWRDRLAAELRAIDRAYVVVVLSKGGEHSATFATLPAELVPVVLRGIANDLESKAQTIEPIEGGN